MSSHIREALLRRLPSFAKSKVFENAVSLYLVQGLQYLIPLISFPWMVRALGSDGYGIFALSGACGAYVQAICDYGFSLSATRSVSQHRDDVIYLREIFSSIFWSKLLLGVASLLLSAILIMAIPKYRVNVLALAIGCISSAIASHFPAWLFQGMERMRQMAILSVLSKILQLLLLILLIHSPKDLLKSLLIFGATNAALTVAAWIFAAHSFRVRLSPPCMHSMREVLVEGFEVFVSQIGVVAFSNANILVLGVLASPAIVGEYSIAEKVVRVGINLGGPIGGALFPHVAALVSESKEKAYVFLKKCMKIGGLLFAGISLAIFASSGIAVQVVSGIDSPRISNIIRILSPLPLSIFVGNILGTQVLLNLGFKREFMTATVTAGLLSIVMLFLLVPLFSAYGAALSLLSSELWVLLFFAINVHRKSDFFRSQASRT